MRLVILQNGVAVPFSTIDGNCVVELTDYYLQTAELNEDDDLLLTMNNAVTHLVPLSSVYMRDFRLPVVVVLTAMDVATMQINEVDTSAGVVNFLVPAASLFEEGEIIIFRRNGANTLNLNTFGPTTINGIGTLTLTEDYRVVWFTKRGNDWTAIADYDEAGGGGGGDSIFTLEANNALWGANTATIPGNPRGARAVDIQGYRTSATQIAAGYGSVAIGNSVTAAGNRSIAIGEEAETGGAGNNIAIGRMANADVNSIAIGYAAVINAPAIGGGIAIGQSANVASIHSIAMGRSATVTTGDKSIAIGYTAAGSGENGIVVGPYANNASLNGLAIGSSASVAASSDNAIAIGNTATASSVNSIVIGTSTIGTAQESGIAIGNALTSAGGGYNSEGNILIGATLSTGNLTENSVVMGRGIGIGTDSASSVAILGSIGNSAIGTIAIRGTIANGAGSAIAIGPTAASAANAISIGQGNDVLSNASIALGTQANVQSDATNSIAIGSPAAVQQYSPSSVAVGDTASVGTNSPNSISIGVSSSVANNAQSSISIGDNAASNVEFAITIGSDVTTGSSAAAGITIGKQALNNGGANNISIGSYSAIGLYAQYSTAIGSNTSVSATRGTAIGPYASVGQYSPASIAIGYVAVVGASSAYGISIGNNANVGASSYNSIAIGNGASVVHGQSVAIGQGVTSTTGSQLSIGVSNAPTEKIVLDNGQLIVPALDINGHITEQVTTVSTGSNYVINMALGTVWVITLTGSITINFSNVVLGRSCTVNIIQGGAGSYTVTWTGVTWPGGTAPTLSTGVGQRDKLVFDSYNGAAIDGSLAGLNYS